jgi:hypothetical protein
MANSLRTSFGDSDNEILESGFSLVKDEAQDDDFKCPHCEAIINGREDITLLGDASCCIKCNKPLFEVENSTQVREDSQSINREEFSAAWDEMQDFEAMDYEVDD